MTDVADQNVLLILIVQQHLLVEMRNVLTLVIVLKMLIALQGITGAYANVGLAIQAIHMALLVLQVRSIRPNYVVYYYRHKFEA